MAKTYVYIYLEEGPIPVGLLEMVGESRETISHFHYGRRYLQRKDGIAVDPIQLPLHDYSVERDYITPQGFSLFNGIRDAIPDGWGRYLMDRAAGAHILSEYDYLIATGDDRVGALAFGPDLSGPQRITFWEKQPLHGESFDLANLLIAVKELDTSSHLPPEHIPLLLPGSSLGGARPKATTEFEGKQWIAKFSRINDRYPVCRAEYATMRLATMVGLHVPRLRLEKILGQDIYLIERFDRISSVRIPFISGLTLTGAHESEASQQSYRSLAEQIRLYGSKFQEDTLELWRRMIFNILCNNTDDHLRNHGFLWDGKGWRLSPAYDIVPLPQVGQERYLAIGVGKNGRQATLKNALTDISSFGLSQKEAIDLAYEMQQQIKDNWEQVFKESGFTAAEIEQIQTCFIACQETLVE